MDTGGYDNHIIYIYVCLYTKANGIEQNKRINEKEQNKK